MSMEELKLQAQRAKAKKQMDKAKEDPSSLRGDDTMVVLHKDEVALIEALLWDVLEKDSSEREIYPNEKRTALNILKHLEVI